MSDWVTLIEMDDRIEAEIIKEALEAQGIMAEIFQEGAAHYAYPMAHAPLNITQVCVPAEQLEAAQAWLARYENGEFEQEKLAMEENPAETTESEEE